MAYIKQTFKYIVRAFLILAPVCLPAAIVLGIFTKPMASLSYLVDYSQTYINGFKDFFWLIFSKSALHHVYPLFLIFFSLVFCVSLALSIVEKHFRVGKLMLVSPLKQINCYFLPVFLSFFILALILVLYSMLQTSLLALLHAIMSGRGYPTVLNMIFAAVLSVGLFVLAVFLGCSTMYWTPMMVIYGFSFRDAAASSFRLIDHKSGGILFGVLLPFLIVAVLQSVASFIPSKIACVIVAVVLYLFLIMYLVAYIMISMFDLSDMERRDVKTSLGGNKRGV